MNSNSNDTSFSSQSRQNSITIEQLYQKFEGLKHRVINQDVKKISKSIDKRSIFQNKRKIVNIKPMQLQSEKYSMKTEEDKSNLEFKNTILSESSLKDLIENNLAKLIFQNLQKITQNMTSKIAILQKKLKNSSTQIRNLKISLKKKEEYKKYNFQKQDKLNLSCQAEKKQRSILSFKSPSQNFINMRQVSQISKKYQSEIKSIIENYQNKISILISEGSLKQKNTKASSSFDKKSQLSQVELIKQCSSFQQKILLKQQELNQLKIDNNRLKRMLDQSNKNYQSNSQLNRLLKQQNKDLQEKVKKFQTLKKNWLIEKKDLEFQIEKLKNYQKKQVKIWKQEVKKLNLEIKTLKSSIFEAQKQKYNQEKQKDQKEIGQSKKLRNSSALDELDTVKSQSSNTIHKQQDEYQILQLDLQGIRKNIKKSQSLLFNRKNMPQQQKELICQIKSLQAEINLLSQQNRLLKLKKDKFQEQIKHSQEDEQRFQQQSQILKQQIKRLNAYVRKLQDCGVILLKKQQLTIDKVNELQEQSRLKELFYKTKVKVQRRGASCRK